MTGLTDVACPGDDPPELRYFTRFVPRAARIDPALADADVADRFRVPPGPDPTAMHRDADLLGGVAAALRAHLLVQEQAAARLEPAWRGVAAAAAAAATGRRLDHAHTVCAGIAAVARTLAEAATLIDDARGARAALVGGLDAAAVGGRSVAQIDRMLADPTEPVWLGVVFVPHVRAHLDALSALCEATAALVDGVTGLLDRLTAAVDAVDAVDGRDTAGGAAAPEPVLGPTPAVEPTMPALDPEPVTAAGDATSQVVPALPEPPDEPEPEPEPGGWERAPTHEAGSGAGPLGFVSPRPDGGRRTGAVGVDPVPTDDGGSGADLAAAGPM